jgi:hypothetical protein
MDTIVFQKVEGDLSHQGPPRLYTDVENGVQKLSNPDKNGARKSEDIIKLEAEETPGKKLLFYEINDEPPWYLTLFLGFQVKLVMLLLCICDLCSIL